MAQAVDALAKVPLASPQPTAPPDPRDAERSLFIRQLTPETCGWVDAQSKQPFYCPVGSGCAYNTADSAAFCCGAASFPKSCTYKTACYDTLNMASSCNGTCVDDQAVAICTSSGSEYCQATVFYYSAVNYMPLSTWNCGPEAGEARTVYDYASYSAAASSYTYESASAAAASGPLITTVVSSSTLTPSSSGSISTSASPGPSTTSTTSLGPVTATPTAVQNPNPKSGLSGGAIAGIVVGVIALIVLALGMILLYRYFKGRKPPPPTPRHLAHDTTTQPTSNRASNFTMPANAPLYSPTTNELSPEESKFGSYPASRAFPQFSVQHGG